VVEANHAVHRHVERDLVPGLRTRCRLALERRRFAITEVKLEDEALAWRGGVLEPVLAVPRHRLRLLERDGPVDLLDGIDEPALALHGRTENERARHAWPRKKRTAARRIASLEEDRRLIELPQARSGRRPIHVRARREREREDERSDRDDASLAVRRHEFPPACHAASSTGA